MQKHIAYSIIRLLYFGVLAQLEERYTGSVEVRGSSPLCSTISPSESTVFGWIFCVVHTKIACLWPEIAKKRGTFPSDFRDFLDFGHNCPAVAFDEFLNAAAEGDGSSDVVAQRREGEFGGDLFLASAKEMTTVIVVFDGAEGMLAGLLAKLLPSNIPPDEHHDALFGAL